MLDSSDISYNSMHILFSSHQLPESITSNHSAHLYMK